MTCPIMTNTNLRADHLTLNQPLGAIVNILGLPVKSLGASVHLPLSDNFHLSCKSNVSPVSSKGKTGCTKSRVGTAPAWRLCVSLVNDCVLVKSTCIWFSWRSEFLFHSLVDKHCVSWLVHLSSCRRPRSLKTGRPQTSSPCTTHTCFCVSVKSSFANSRRRSV